MPPSPQDDPFNNTFLTLQTKHGQHALDLSVLSSADKREFLERLQIKTSHASGKVWVLKAETHLGQTLVFDHKPEQHAIGLMEFARAYHAWQTNTRQQNQVIYWLIQVPVSLFLILSDLHLLALLNLCLFIRNFVQHPVTHSKQVALCPH